MSQIKVINNYPVTKLLQSELAAEIMQPLIDGEIDPIEFITKVKGLINSLIEVEKNKDVKDIVIREIEKTGKQASWSGAVITVKETGVKYDFSNCNDPVYFRLKFQIADLEKRLKERETFLKSIPDSYTVLDEETGEVYQLSRPVRMATESFSISFKKQ